MRKLYCDKCGEEYDESTLSTFLPILDEKHRLLITAEYCYMCSIRLLTALRDPLAAWLAEKEVKMPEVQKEEAKKDAEIESVFFGKRSLVGRPLKDRKEMQY